MKNLLVIFVTLNDVCWLKDAKVWIPDASVVWKCASLLDDYKGSQQALRICYEEDGTVSVSSLLTVGIIVWQSLTWLILMLILSFYCHLLCYISGCASCLMSIQFIYAFSVLAFMYKTNKLLCYFSWQMWNLQCLVNLFHIANHNNTKYLQYN